MLGSLENAGIDWLVFRWEDCGKITMLLTMLMLRPLWMKMMTRHSIYMSTVQDSPSASLLYMFVDIRNTNQLSWAINWVGVGSDCGSNDTCQLFRILHLLPAPDVCAVLQVHPASCHASIKSQQQTFGI